MRILHRSIIPFLVEGKLENLQAKYPDYIKEIDELSQRDPSSTKKYLEYAVKVLVSGQALVTEIGDVIVLFHKFQNKFEPRERDINFWKNFTDLRDKLFELEQSGEKSKTAQKKEIKAGGSKKLYEDEQVTLFFIKSKDASCTYGSGTKWCVTMRDKHYFEEYSGQNIVLIYALRKDLTQEDPNYKVALVFQRDTNNKIVQKQYFDALDTEFEKPKPLKSVKNLQQILSIAENAAAAASKSTLAKLVSKEITIDQVPESERDDNMYRLVLKNTESIIPMDVVERFIAQNDSVVKYIARKDWMTVEMLLQFAQKYTYMYKYVAIAGKQVSPDILERLIYEELDSDEQFAYKGLIHVVIEKNLLSVDKLLDIANNNHQMYKHILLRAKNIPLPVEILNKFSKSKKYSNKIGVIYNPNVTSEILEKLSQDKDSNVRWNVAKQHNLPIKVIKELSKDKDKNVRNAIAENPSTPQKIKDKINSFKT